MRRFQIYEHSKRLQRDEPLGPHGLQIASKLRLRKERCGVMEVRRLARRADVNLTGTFNVSKFRGDGDDAQTLRAHYQHHLALR